MTAYYTYAVGTTKDEVVYLLADIKKQRIWTRNPKNAMTFFSEDEVQHLIQMFNIPDAAIARIKHKA